MEVLEHQQAGVVAEVAGRPGNQLHDGAIGRPRLRGDPPRARARPGANATRACAARATREPPVRPCSRACPARRRAGPCRRCRRSPRASAGTGRRDAPCRDDTHCQTSQIRRMSASACTIGGRRVDQPRRASPRSDGSFPDRARRSARPSPRDPRAPHRPPAAGWPSHGRVPRAAWRATSEPVADAEGRFRPSTRCATIGSRLALDRDGPGRTEVEGGATRRAYRP